MINLNFKTEKNGISQSSHEEIYTLLQINSDEKRHKGKTTNTDLDLHCQNTNRPKAPNKRVSSHILRLQRCQTRRTGIWRGSFSINL